MKNNHNFFFFFKQSYNCRSLQRKERKGRTFVLGFFLVYNRTRPIKQIGQHNRFVKLNGFVLWPCHPVVIHFFLDKVAGPHRKRIVKSFPPQDVSEKKGSHYLYVNHRLLEIEGIRKSLGFCFYKRWKRGRGLGLENLSFFFFFFEVDISSWMSGFHFLIKTEKRINNSWIYHGNFSFDWL